MIAFGVVGVVVVAIIVIVVVVVTVGVQSCFFIGFRKEFRK